MNRFQRSLDTYARVTERSALPQGTRRAWGRLLTVSLGFVAVSLGFVAASFTDLRVMPQPASPAPLSLSTTRDLALSPDVAARGEGAGTWTRNGDQLAIMWDIGQLELDVTPGRGVDLRVQTEEAELQVIGTHFLVDRGPLGTRVEVARGAVRLGCVGADPRVLRGGDTTLCTPNRAPGLLRRARALERLGEAELALSEVERALADPSRSAVLQDELLALRVALLAGLGRDAEGLAAARAYLGLPNPAREHDILAIAAELSPDPDTRCDFLDRLDPRRAHAERCPDKSGTLAPPTGTRIRGDTP